MDCVRVWKEVDGETLYVTIDTASVKNNLTKIAEVLTTPKGGSNGTSNTVDSKAIDLSKIEDRFTITGHISKGRYSYSPTDTSDEAKDKKNNLKTIVGARGTLNFSYDSETFEVICDKVEITKVFSDGTEADTDEVGYDVTMTLQVSTNLISS
jgi:hypothetical protein